jgi:hypothetical protein
MQNKTYNSIPPFEAPILQVQNLCCNFIFAQKVTEGAWLE